jgi:hypothetical protein
VLAISGLDGGYNLTFVIAATINPKRLIAVSILDWLAIVYFPGLFAKCC